MEAQIAKERANQLIEERVRSYEKSLEENLEYIKQTLRNERAREVVNFAFEMHLITPDERKQYMERLNKY
jgi:hypothetical protein